MGAAWCPYTPLGSGYCVCKTRSKFITAWCHFKDFKTKMMEPNSVRRRRQVWYKGQKLCLESFRLDVKKYLLQYLESWNLIP